MTRGAWKAKVIGEARRLAVLCKNGAVVTFLRAHCAARRALISGVG